MNAVALALAVDVRAVGPRPVAHRRGPGRTAGPRGRRRRAWPATASPPPPGPSAAGNSVTVPTPIRLPLRIRPQETGRPRRAVAAQDVDGFQQGLSHGRRLDVQHAQHARRVAPEAAVAPQDVVQRVRRDRVRERGRPGDQVSETLPSGVGPRSPRRAPRRCPARRAAPFPARRMPEAPRGPRPSRRRAAIRSARGFTIRPADDPVVGLHHRVGDERLPLDGADHENREGGGCPGARGSPSANRVIRCGGMSPKRPSEPRGAGDARGGPAAGWRRPNCCPARTAGATRTVSRRRRPSLRAASGKLGGDSKVASTSP